MSAIYKTFFELTISHNYYDNGVCRDLIINPLPETAKLLLGHKLIYKKGVNSFKILFCTDDTGETPLIKLDEGIKLTFSIHLNNPTFLNFTDLPPKFADKYIYHFENTKRGEKIERDLLDEYEIDMDVESIPQSSPAKFNYDFTSENDKVTLQVTDPAGKLIVDQELEPEKGSFSKELDFRESPFGVYTFSRIVNQVLEKRESIFFADPIKVTRPFGLITFQKDESLKYNKSSKFNISFQSRSVPWKYNLKLTKDFVDPDFSLTDGENYINGNQSRYHQEITFIMREEIENYSKGKVIVFESGEMLQGEFQPQKVPYYQSPKKYLKLKMDNGEKTLIEHLPNPAINNLKSEVYINV